MAWAEKLPSGKYRGLYRDAAKKKRSAGIFTHKAKAVRAAGAKEEHARRQMVRDPEAHRRPWGEWCDEWWPSRGVEPSTLRNDAARRRNHLDPRWAAVPVGAIDRQAVKDWAASLRRGGLGPESVKRCVHLLSASLSAAVDAEILNGNVAARIGLQKGAQAQERFLTYDEYVALRDQMPTTKDQLILDLLCFTGLRWGELAGLHRARVDLRRGVLRVVETYDETAQQIKAYPKGKSARDVPLTPYLVKALGDQEDAVGDCGVEHATGRCPGPLMLTSEEGRPLRNSNWAYRVWKPAVEHARVGHVRPHDCRHTYASWLLQRGVPLAEVGRLMGHRSTQTTDKYAHLADIPTAAVLAALAAPQMPHDEPAEAPDAPWGGSSVG